MYVYIGSATCLLLLRNLSTFEKSFYSVQEWIFDFEVHSCYR